MLVIGLFIGFIIGAIVVFIYTKGKSESSFLTGYYRGLRCSIDVAKELETHKKDFDDCLSSREVELNREWNNAIDYCIQLFQLTRLEKFEV